MIWKGSKDNNLTEAQIIEGCKTGKAKFQELLYKQFFSFAMSICTRYAKSNDEAMEVVNDSFLKVFEKIASYDASKPFKSWFAKILVNTAIDTYRRNLKQNSTLSLGKTHEFEELDPNIEHELSAEDILKLFAELPDTLRITFNLYEVEGYSHEEIGEILGVATSTSRANLARAKQLLRTLYNQNFNTIGDSYEPIRRTV